VFDLQGEEDSQEKAPTLLQREDRQGRGWKSEESQGFVISGAEHMSAF